MAKPLPLNTEELQALRAKVPAWHIDDQGHSMRRVFEFKDFVQAFAFMTQVARLAQQQDHHPHWTHVYATVEVVLSTHEVGALTLRGQTLALDMDQVWGPFSTSIQTV
jgi:4a-hydroxytetrahydrobiopterin dehydratase